MPVIESSIKKGEPRWVGEFELTPLTNVLKVQVPGRLIGFIWNRPRSVVVRTVDGQERVLPVSDVTRVMIWAMLAGGIAGAIAMGLLSRFK
jgi:hypothetical protein